jgi:hypothetical protein
VGKNTALAGSFSAQESSWAILTGNLTILTIHALLKCKKEGFIEPDSVYKFVIENHHGKFPPEGTPGDCTLDSMSIGNLTSYYTVPSGDENDLKEKIFNMGPAVVGLDGSRPTFLFYKGGIYDDPSCSSVNLTGVFSCVGYGIENKIPFWIVQNTIGTYWGERGYIRLVRDKKNQCGIASFGVIPVNK